MTGRTHVVCGTATLLGIASIYPATLTVGPVTVVPWIGLAMVGLGSLLPDIDHPNTRLGRKYHFISRHCTHRGITHTLLFPALFTFLMYLTSLFNSPSLGDSKVACKAVDILVHIVPASLLFGLAIGWLSHVIADLFNPKGCPILWPIIPYRIHLARIYTRNDRTGEHRWGEQIFTYLYCGGVVLWAITLRTPLLLDFLKLR